VIIFAESQEVTCVINGGHSSCEQLLAANSEREYNNNDTGTMYTVLSSWLKVIARVHPNHPVHAINAEQRQVATDLWTNPTDLSHKPACMKLGNCIHHRHLLLLNLKADTHFTIPWRVEDWVDLDDWLHTQTVYLPASSHLSK